MKKWLDSFCNGTKNSLKESCSSQRGGIKESLVTLLYISVTCAAAFGWWGLLYPELTMTPDTYRVIVEEMSSGEEGFEEWMEWDFDSDIYYEILNSDREQIRFKSKAFQTLKEIYKSVMESE